MKMKYNSKWWVVLVCSSWPLHSHCTLQTPQYGLPSTAGAYNQQSSFFHIMEVNEWRPLTSQENIFDNLEIQ